MPTGPKKIFRQMREGGVDAVHVTIAYHENFRETVLNFERGTAGSSVSRPDHEGAMGARYRPARDTGRTAIFFGFQNPSPIEDDIGLVEIVHTLGARFMQLTYNNQSLLATGCYEAEDPGITRMGRQVIGDEPRRAGRRHEPFGGPLDHRGADLSERPIAITHANPHDWHPRCATSPTR
jgi:membrane dipeptidase